MTQSGLTYGLKFRLNYRDSMGNILTLTQSPNAKTVNLLPNGAGTFTQFEKIGDDANWKCVDDIIDACDEDTTYVHSVLINHNYMDTYNIENVPSNITDGMINYVTVHAIAKSDTYPPASDTLYDLGLMIGASGYQPWYCELTTSYAEYKHSWTGNPLGGNWTWADINNIEIGVSALVKPVSGGGSTTRTLYTSGKDTEECEGKYCGTIDNWEHVHPDNPSCLVRNNKYRLPIGTDVKEDIHVMEDIPPAERGDTITKVVLWGKFKTGGCLSAYMDGDEWQCRLAIKPNVAKFYSDYFILLEGIPPEEHENPYATKTYHYTWTQNPDTSLDWTWDDIDDLNIGYELIVVLDATDFTDWEICGSYTRTQCKEIWAVIFYTTTVTPEVRTSANWLTVNYTPVDTVCNITMPSHVSRTVDENINAINFWDGTREVYFESQNLKTMVLEGYEYGSGADDRIICVRDMGRDGNVISIAGFSNDYHNTTYRIASYGWKLVSKLPLYYKWILELQELEEE